MTSDIRKALGEIVSDHKKGLTLSLFFVFLWVVHLLTFLWPSLFVSPMMVPTINLLLDFDWVTM
jgi:hypothetical protein